MPRMNRVLAALSFPMLILAGALLWHVYSVYAGRIDPVPSWQLVLEMTAALLLIIAGMAGVRLRHRPPEDHQ
jgi:predicted membrane protein